MTYELSRTIAGHSRDARTLDYFNGLLVTGGADKVLNLYQYSQGQLTLLFSSNIFQKNILSVKLSRNPLCPILVLAGCNDGKIYAFDNVGNPLSMYEHNSPISSVDFINQDTFVSGSWDGRAIIWNITDHKQLRSYDNHKYAVTVFYNAGNDMIISGSQDKALNMWDWKTGNIIKRVESAHGDIIRQISVVDEVGFITCSNDQTLKLWTSQLEEVQTFTGHSAFVFTVKALQLGRYFSGGEDKSLKIWNDTTCVQSISFPASIWSIALHPNNHDIFVASSDGLIRIFTTDITRKATQDQIIQFNKDSLDAASKKSGMSVKEIQKLPTSHQMSTIKGKKEGEVRVFRNGMNPQAYIWQAGKWDKIGDVITEGGGTGTVSQSKYYPGDKYFEAGQYDYIFDVDDQSGAPKTIPFNDGANALQAAEKYCMREGLTKGYIEQIRKFLMQNSSNIPRANKKPKEQINQQQNSLTLIPQMSIIQFNDIKNPTALFNKVKEFNQNVENNKLNEKELAHIERLVGLLEHSSNYHTWSLDFKQLDALKKLLGWPKKCKFPVWDIFRAYLKHYQSQTLFSGLQNGLDYISQLCAGLQSQNTEPIYALILKTLSNIAIQNTNKQSLLKYGQIIFTSIHQISKRPLSNKSYLSAMASFLYNFSISALEKKFEQEKVLKFFCEILKIRMELDADQQNLTLMLYAAGNILSKNKEIVGKHLLFVNHYLQGSKISKDLNLLLNGI